MQISAALFEKTERLFSYMMYVWGHSYEFTDQNNWELMEQFCEMMSGKEDIWYATNIEIVDYMKAAENLKYTVNGDKVWNPNACTVWISIDGKIIEIPGGTTVDLSSE